MKQVLILGGGAGGAIVANKLARELRREIARDEVSITVLDKDGVTIQLNKGKVNFVFDAYIETDYEHRWEGKPLFYFLRVIFDKYVFKPYTKGYEGNVMADLNELYASIKTFLNTHRIQTPAVTGKAHTDATPTP